MTSKSWVVAKREFNERVRTRWFAIVTLLGPIGMIAIVVIPAYLTVKSVEEGFRVDIVDRTGGDIGRGLQQFSDMVGETLRTRVVAPETEPGVLRERIRNKEIDGFLLFPEDMLEGGKVLYQGDNAGNVGFKRALKELVRVAAVAERGRQMDIAPEKVARLLEPVNFEALHTTGAGKAKSGEASFFVGYAVMIILYMAILLYAVNVMRSVVTEKASRVVEIIVSSVKPRELMMGKVLGVGGVGLFQLSIWALIAVLIIRFRSEILGLFGVPGVAAMDIPSVGLDAIFLALLYFLLGFFFYAALYAAIGAMVSSEQEAQQAQTPVVLLLIIPVACVQIVAGDPRGAIAQALTQLPVSSPILMPMRYLLDGASLAELCFSLAILTLTMLATVMLAARIYRVGILMTGKRPRLRELLRWINA